MLKPCKWPIPIASKVSHTKPLILGDALADDFNSLIESGINAHLGKVTTITVLNVDIASELGYIASIEIEYRNFNEDKKTKLVVEVEREKELITGYYDS